MDGVVNSARYFRAGSHTKYRRIRGERKARLRASKPLSVLDAESAREMFESLVDPAVVRLLNEVVERTGCLVVSSSSWRITWTPEELTQIMATVGFRGRVVDRTPGEYVMPVGVTEHQRGYEIDAWLQAHPEVEAYAIIDDADDMAHLKDHLVQTTWGEGMLSEHVEPLVALLTKPVR